jgi:hypothetical protein
VTFLALTEATLVLGLLSAWAALGAERARRALLAFAALTALGCASLWFVESAVARDLTILHEGGTARTLDALYGVDQHVGPLWRDAARSLAWRPGELPVVTLVRVNFLLAALAVAGLTVLAATAAGSPAAGLVALALLAASRAFWNGLYSETPAPALWFAVVAAAPAWKILDEARERPRGQRLLALASVASSAGLAVGLRSEFAPLGGLLTLLALAAALRADLIDGAWARAREFTLRALRSPWPIRLALALALALWNAAGGGVDFHRRLALAAVVPSLAPQAPAALCAVTPWPVVGLALVGVASLARGGPPRAAFAFATAGLLSVYLVASHGVGWELLRYGAMAAMTVWLAAVAGWCALEDFARERGWHPAWRSSAAALALLFVPVPGSLDPLGPGWWDADARVPNVPFRRLVNQSHQREARLIVGALADEPACLFVARVRRRGEPDDALELVTWRRGQAPAPVAPSVTVRDLRPTAGVCLRYVRSLDCNLRRATGCDDDLRGAEALRVVRERLAAYDDPKEYGAHAAEVTYGVWRVGD